jgi:hypothetical protein
MEPRGQHAQDLHWVVWVGLLDRLRAHGARISPATPPAR